MSPFGRCRADGAAGRGGMAFPRRTHAFLHFPQLYTIMAVSSSGNIILLSCIGRASFSSAKVMRQTALVLILPRFLTSGIAPAPTGKARPFTFCGIPGAASLTRLLFAQGGLANILGFGSDLRRDAMSRRRFFCLFGCVGSAEGDRAEATCGGQKSGCVGGRTDNLLKSAVKFL